MKKNGKETPKKETPKKETKKETPNKKKKETKEIPLKKRKLELNTESFYQMEDKYTITTCCFSELNNEFEYLSFGNRYGNLIIFKVTKDLEYQHLHTIQAHESQITSMKCYSNEFLITGSLDGLIKFWNLKDGKEIKKNISLPLDGIPILILENLIFQNQQYFAFSKGFDVYLIQEISNSMNIYTLEGHSSNITSIVIGAINDELTIYTSSTDGSLIKWKLINNEIKKKVEIEKNYQQPIWGCQLSPNNFYLSLLIEFPSENQFSAFAYLSKKKTKIILYQTIDNTLEKILNLIKNIFTQGSNELPYKYPIDDLLKFLEQVPEKTIKSLFEKLDQEYTQNMNYFKLLVLILSKSSFSEIKEEMTQKLLDTRAILTYHHCSNTIIHYSEHSNMNTMLSICDWILLFWTSQLMVTQDQFFLCFQNMKVIEEIYTKYSNQDNVQVLKIVQQMIQKCQGNEIEINTNIEYPKRVSCPFCDEKVPITLNFSKKFCSKKHPFELCPFTFEPMGHKIMKCNVCGVKSSFRENSTCILCGSNMK